jgi:sterol O-acyltransferase
MFSRDARMLALSDAVLVLSTGICVPFAKAVSRGWIKYYWTGVVIQHTFQTFILFAAIKWTFNRCASSFICCNDKTDRVSGSQWPWVQSGFLTLHTLVRVSNILICTLLNLRPFHQTMIMKMHSYMATNGYLCYLSQQSAATLNQLRNATSRVGGWDKAISDAKKRHEDLEREADASSSSTATSSSPFDTPERPESMSTSYEEVPNVAALRRRLIQVAGPTAVPDDDKPKDAAFYPLVDHPDPQISALATEYAELESEIVSSGPERVRWPENITFKNFAVYQLIPTLVYELEYPRTKRYGPDHCVGLSRPILLPTGYVPFTCLRRQSPLLAPLHFFTLPRRRSSYHTLTRVLNSLSRERCWT